MRTLIRKSFVVPAALAGLIACLTISADERPKIPREVLIGSWMTTPAEPGVYPRQRFVFSEDHRFTVYDEGGPVIAKWTMSAITDHSFVSEIVHAPKDLARRDIEDTSLYAVYEILGNNRMKLRFYADRALTTKIAVLYLDRTENRVDTLPSMTASPKPSSADERTSRAAEYFEPTMTVDFDGETPDRTFFRNGGTLEVVSVAAINKSRMGLITLPAAIPGIGPSDLPNASFVVNYQGKLENTIAGFRTYIPGILPYGSYAPYIVLAVSLDDDLVPEAYVVGNRIIGLDPSPPPPEQPCPVQTWLECRFDADTLVHVAGFRGNLGREFTTENYGPLGSLVKRSLRDDRNWGDSNVVFIQICAGVRPGPAFRAYVDDITVGSREGPRIQRALSP